jgi:hypothetical protein
VLPERGIDATGAPAAPVDAARPETVVGPAATRVPSEAPGHDAPGIVGLPVPDGPEDPDDPALIPERGMPS